MATLQPLGGGSHPVEQIHRSFADAVAATKLKSSDPTGDPSHSIISIAATSHAKPISGTHKGLPSAYFPDSAIADYSRPLKWILVGKFSKGFNKQNPKLGRPAVENIEKFFISLDLKDHVLVGMLDNRHIMISLKNEGDFLRLYSRKAWVVEGKLMRIFKWTPDFHVDKESSLVPVWIKFPKLPLHFFNGEALFTLGSLIGIPLRMDATTANLTRPSYARIQVEFDLLREMPEKIWIGYGNNDGFWQKVEVEQLPSYCSFCWHVGHKEEECTVKFPECKKYPAENEQLRSSKEIRREYRPKAAQPQVEGGDSQQPLSIHEKGESSNPPETVIDPPLLEKEKETSLVLEHTQRPIDLQGEITPEEDTVLTKETSTATLEKDNTQSKILEEPFKTVPEVIPISAISIELQCLEPMEDRRTSQPDFAENEHPSSELTDSMLAGIRREVAIIIPDSNNSSDILQAPKEDITLVGRTTEAICLNQKELQDAKEDLIQRENLSPRDVDQSQTASRMVTRKRPARKNTPSQEPDKISNV